MKKWLITIGIALVTGMNARADALAPPKTGPLQHQTLTGTLSWKMTKRPDGTEQKSKLQLTTDDQKVIDLASAMGMKDQAKYDKLIGTRVEAKVATQTTTDAKGKTTLNVNSIEDIKEAPQPKK